MKAIEIVFALPVELTDDEQRYLVDFADRICKRHCPVDWAFWPAGIGSKPNFSQADAQFLGKPVDSSAPLTGEPVFDNDTYQIDCAARPLYPSEIERQHKRHAS
jgi:hypothetical protein